MIRVVVSVGTDHHPFERMLDWFELAADRLELDILVQRGATADRSTIETVDYLSADELLQLMRSADAVVCHGGPGTISLAKRSGHRPIVIARDPTLGEHVDDHQQRYIAKLAVEGSIDSVGSVDELVTLLSAPRPASDHDSSDSTALAVSKFGEFVDQLLAGCAPEATLARSSQAAPDTMSTIVFIGAVGRSGTTLLERTLATSPHTVALGEMVHLWHRSARHDESCGCGLAFGDCPFWHEVGQRAFGGWEQVALDEIDSDRLRVDRNRYIPFLIAPQLAPPSFRAARRRYLEVLDRLYGAIHDVASQSRPGVVLIDSSKHPSYLFLIRGLTSHRLHLLHVTRDPRGVANSWAKQVARPEDGDHMEQLGTMRAIARWTSHNLSFQLAGWIGVPRRRLSYERFTSDPLELGRKVDDLLTSDQTTIVQQQLAIDDHTVTLDVDHTVSGNPMRFTVGPVAIRSDESWRNTMPQRQQLVVGTLTTPLRQVYAR